MSGMNLLTGNIALVSEDVEPITRCTWPALSTQDWNKAKNSQHGVGSGRVHKQSTVAARAQLMQPRAPR